MSEAVTRATDDEIERRVGALDGWLRVEETIRKTFELADFPHAVGFVVEVGMIAEAAWHHPEITLHGWNKVTVSTTTHDAGGLSAKDFDLAEKIEASLKHR